MMTEFPTPNPDFQATEWATVAFPSGFEQNLTYHLPQNHSVQIGQIVTIEVRKRPTWGIVLEISHQNPPFKTLPIQQILPFLISPERFAFLKWLHEYYLSSWNYILDMVYPKKYPEWILNKPKTKKSAPPQESPLPELNAEQQLAVQSAQTYIEQKQFHSFLLWGITGSGKTRVFTEMMRLALNTGKNVLILVPEINLTPQTQAQFQKGCPFPIFIQHSAITPAQKKHLWQNAMLGQIRVLMGTRSALLAPFENIGLIIVDEEHDSSYKQEDPTPRYHARDSALVLGRIYKCPVVLGSATPSLESYSNALAQKHTLLRLTQKAATQLKPIVSKIALLECFKKEGSQRLISTPLREKIQAVLDKKEQVVLLLNRRGHSTARICASCGEVHRCFDCSVSTTLHKQKNHLECHSCARIYRTHIPCHKCQGTEFIYEGSGIEKLEEEIKMWFPTSPCLRIDRDNTPSAKESEQQLEDFRNEKYSIMIGTQMIAKGHDFPKVTLAAMIIADASLGMPDFRAGERTFQLLSQLGGRSGRHTQGQVCFQCFNPSDPILEYALQENFEGFAEYELAERKALAYPPFTRGALIEIRNQNSHTCKLDAQKILNFMQQTCKLQKLSPTLLGPAAAPKAQAKKYFRYHIFIKDASSKNLHALIKATQKFIGSQKPFSEYRLDIDPLNLI